MRQEIHTKDGYTVFAVGDAAPFQVFYNPRTNRYVALGTCYSEEDAARAAIIAQNYLDGCGVGSDGELLVQ